MEEEDDYKQPTVRWLNAARYAVAALVTALTIVIIAKAAAVSLRSEKLDIGIINGYVAVDTITSMAEPLIANFHFNFRCYNPSGRASVRYTNNVNVTLLYNNGTEVTWFPVDDKKIKVEPDFYRDVFCNLNLSSPDEVPTEFLRWIYNGYEWKDMTVLFTGMLQTQVSLLGYTKGHFTTYICPQVTIGNSTQYNSTTIAPCNLN